MAKLIQVSVDTHEEIVSYTHDIFGEYIIITIGLGALMPDGTFKERDRLSAETVSIIGDLYTQLLSMGPITIENLWVIVSQFRAVKQLELEAEITNMQDAISITELEVAPASAKALK